MGKPSSLRAYFWLLLFAGLGFRPAPRNSETGGGSIIWYQSNNMTNVNTWIEQIDEFLERTYKSIIIRIITQKIRKLFFIIYFSSYVLFIRREFKEEKTPTKNKIFQQAAKTCKINFIDMQKSQLAKEQDEANQASDLF